LNVSEKEWAAWNAPSEAKLQQRLEDVQLVRDPEGVVATAVTLLQSQRWEEIAVGLAVTTGRRLSEVLKTGEFVLEEPYTVLFAGQLKRRDKILDPYEIPTLCAARLVVDAWQRLRSLQDCSAMDAKQISHELGPLVSATADRYFSAYVPPRDGRDDLYTHLCRTIYARIAWLFYGPDHVVDLKFMARIQGHYWVLEATGQAQYDYMATLHYNDYRIADADGKIDGRQGIKLGEPGVTVLKVYQEREKMAPTKAQKSRKDKAEDMTSAASRTGYSMMRPKQQTRQLADAEKERLGLHSDDELILELLRRSRGYDDLAAGSHGVAEISALLHGIEHDNPVAYLRELVERDARFKAGLAKRHAGVNYRAMSLTELEKYKTEGAAQERFRRAVEAVMQYNASVEEPLKRWFLNPNTIRDLVGGRYPAVKAYLDAHKEEIDAHHTQYQITAVFNRKPYGIKEMITVSDVPAEPTTTEPPSDGPDEEA
jgi:hypothetical protein